MKKRLLTLFLGIFLLAIQAIAQQTTVTGRVTASDDGGPLPGVSIKIKGTTTVVQTRADGGYSIQVNPGAVLIFSYIGYLPQEKAVAASTAINVSLIADNKSLNEVVVTAFNIAQDRKSINYAFQNVKSKDIEESRQQNIVNALQGKIAGAVITSSGGGPGEGASIILRGGTSLDGDNQPLFVVDGVALDNSSFVESTSPGAGSAFNGVLGRSLGTANRASDINPEDIESVTVLKGPAAAALYGVKAGNGAIIITTKKGKTGSTSVVYNNLFSWDNVMRLPETQSTYKQGTAGIFAATSRDSYGSQFLPGETIYDNLGDFFITGKSQTHNLSVSGGSEKYTFRFSASHADQTGVVPKTEYGKTSVRLAGSAIASDKFSVTGSANYLRSTGRRPLQGPGLFGGTGGFLVSIFNWPKNDNMKDYLSPDGNRRRLLASVTGDIDNPYFTIDRNPQTDSNDRFLGTAGAEYKPLDWLRLNYTLGTDFYTERNQSVRAVGTSLPNNQNGGIGHTVNSFQSITSNLILTAEKTFGDFSTSLILGNAIDQTKFSTVDYLGLIFQNPDFISINNTVNRSLVQRNSTKRIIGAFGSFNADWKKTIFLNITGRNDWSSTLPTKNRSFFYPSVSIGYEFTKTLKLESDSWLTYGKIRLSYADVGKDTAPYRIESPLQANTFIGGGFRYGFFGNNPELMPETRRSYEVGLDLQFLKNRIRLDATLYSDKTIDQIIAPRVSQATGFILQYINGGSVQNKGIELMLSGTPVQTKDFTWDVNFNFARNLNEVLALPFPLTILRNSDASIINVAEGASYPGKSLTSISATDYIRDPQGRIIIDANGYPTFNTLFSYGGDRAPKFTLGLNNSFRYKNAELSFLIDIRKGGDVINGNEWELVRSGLSKQTEERGKQVVFEGVVQNADGSFSTNTKAVELTQGYYENNLAAVGTAFIEDGSWIRLRTVTLNYTLNKKYLPKVFSNVNLFITGRNLVLFTNYSGIDPEVGVSGAGVRGGGSAGLDYGGVPSRRGFDLGLKVGF
ncbi:SusC/RagA family TonB-linked outer membrane protein [Pedobacter metabolipauper]|uniref:TonB-linked SusC/RagA family outer membrane protein n=1 Tax=Pedobacter metabolipauper TaxID=425513 RepID=A0A4R6SWH8_9SPHI|nr:SusC/RagA family TonB-linked outer membrane protein [Pedobacter metabolipauper]TDQ09749.1 TonB-linked SusC/RagA family outer membrane protein [Pedobacter metabolipauper]